jgi:hypothetical protein
VIPAVETIEPLSAEVASPATVPTETVEDSAATNGETKKEVKSEKRKSSLPFAFGKKKEGSASDEEGEKPKSPSAFSKLRATIKVCHIHEPSGSSRHGLKQNANIATGQGQG